MALFDASSGRKQQIRLVQRRPFWSGRFRVYWQFDTPLPPGQTIPDLYPAILSWAQKPPSAGWLEGDTWMIVGPFGNAEGAGFDGRGILSGLLLDLTLDHSILVERICAHRCKAEQHENEQ